VALSGQANRIPSRVEFDAVQGAHSSSRFCPIVRATGGLIVLGIIAVAYGIHAAMGHEAAFSCIAGALFGWILQRTRFCFLCNFRDFFERREPHGVLAILLAVGVGLIGYHVVIGAWIVDPFAGHLPAKAHITPVGWNLVLGGLAFGLGMGVSGSCMSAHFYRFGEGSLVCLFALIGSVLGFLAGFLTWNPLYLALVRRNLLSGCPPNSALVARCCFSWQLSVFLFGLYEGGLQRNRLSCGEIQPSPLSGRFSSTAGLPGSEGLLLVFLLPRSVADRTFGCDIRVVARRAISR
jgi:uncharacterized membrane protein YedE/YeeE